MDVKNKQLAAAIELYKSAESDPVRQQAIGIITAMADGGDVTACLILGVNYDPAKEKGFLERDAVKALEWYKKAADLGDAKGANEAAILSFRGGPEVQNKELAAELIQKAVDIEPDNEIYQKNLVVIKGQPKEKAPEPEDNSDADSAGEDGAEVSDSLEKTVIEGVDGNMLWLDVAFGVIILACGGVLAYEGLLMSFLIPFLVLVALVAFINLQMLSCHITVTTRRVSGRISFLRLIDMPLDCISSVGTTAFGGVKVTAASCRGTFYLVKNPDEVRAAIAGLLVKRQESASKAAEVIYREPAISSADELKKLSDLMDEGIITQDEFDSLKDEIIG